MAAIDTGEERLTQELLDEVDIDLSKIPNRDPDAGELPAVPPQPAKPKTRRNRGRNTVFDDRGGRRAATS